ncbi:transposase [Citreimonas salinaria]|uniref:transposase n=1 Tax=Citreimonas salinaria TaxID=321339 RepID=UPI00115F8A8B
MAPRQGALAWPCGAERARIAAEGLASGAKLADVARRHDVTRWQVYDWRRNPTSDKLALEGLGRLHRAGQLAVVGGLAEWPTRRPSPPRPAGVRCRAACGWSA